MAANFFDEQRVRKTQRNIERIVSTYNDLSLYCHKKKIPSITLATCCKMIYEFLVQEMANRADREPDFRKLMIQATYDSGSSHERESKEMIESAISSMMKLIDALKIERGKNVLLDLEELVNRELVNRFDYLNKEELK